MRAASRAQRPRRSSTNRSTETGTARPYHAVMAVSLGRLEVETADHVVLRYDLAGIGTRGNAAILDGIVSSAMVVALFFGAAIIGSKLPAVLSVQLSGLVALLILSSWVAYFVLLEWLWNGQTFGKRQAGIRGIRPDRRAAPFPPGPLPH